MRRLMGALAVVLASVGGSAGATTITSISDLTVSAGGSYTISDYTYLYGTTTVAGTGTLEVLGGSSVTAGNWGTLNNYGTVSNSARLDNYDTLNNYGTLDNDHRLYVYGTLNNYGTLDNSDTVDISGTLSNSGTFSNQSGALVYNTGTLINSGTFDVQNGSTVSGNSSTFTQTGGELIVNGTMTQAAITINGGMLSGSGTISSGAVTNQVTVDNATVSVGASPQTTGALTINGSFDVLGVLGTSTLLFELGGASSYDLIDVNGTASIADGTIFDVDFLGSYAPTVGSIFDLLIADTITVDQTQLVFDFADALGYSWTASLFSLASGQEALRLTASALSPNPVPLPASFYLLLAGLAGFGWVARRRKT